ncbi:MAG: hypothetical protein IJS74_01050 [Clostridia bacterium]|nr:hypothetical protein [Clostridia bacterium]
MEKIAVILLETYSAKLYIAAADPENYFVLQAFQKEPIKLALEEDNDHFLKKPQIDQTIKVLKSYRKVCELHDVTRTIAIANLFRDSKPKNVYSFFDEVYASCGFRFTTLSDDDQNEKIYLGTINSFDVPKGVAVHLSADGLHLVYYNRRNIIEDAVLDVGPVSLLNKFPFEELGKEVALEKIRHYVQTLLGDITWFDSVDPEYGLVVSGDYATDLAKMVRKYKKYPLDRDFGFICTKEELEFISKQVFALELDKTKKIKLIDEPRADVFAVALVILQEVCNAVKMDTISINDNAMVRGILFSEVIPSTMERPISDVLGYSVIAETSFHDAGQQQHNEQVYNLSMLLFKQLRVLHRLSRTTVKVLRVASFMHDVGKRINFIQHAKNAYNVIIGSDIFGVNHRELILAAFVASLHQGGDVSLTEWVKYKDLFEEDDLDAVNKMGIILRLAEAFDYTKNNVIVDITCDILGDSVILKTISTGDSTFEIEKAFEISKDFEKCFHKKLEIL